MKYEKVSSNPLKEKIKSCRTLDELDELRIPIVKDKDNFKDNQKAFVRQKAMIENGGVDFWERSL